MNRLEENLRLSFQFQPHVKRGLHTDQHRQTLNSNDKFCVSTKPRI
jgi:hypothetical protein